MTVLSVIAIAVSAISLGILTLISLFICRAIAVARQTSLLNCMLVLDHAALSDIVYQCHFAKRLK